MFGGGICSKVALLIIILALSSGGAKRKWFLGERILCDKSVRWVVMSLLQEALDQFGSWLDENGADKAPKDSEGVPAVAWRHHSQQQGSFWRSLALWHLHQSSRWSRMASCHQAHDAGEGFVVLEGWIQSTSRTTSDASQVWCWGQGIQLCERASATGQFAQVLAMVSLSSNLQHIDTCWQDLTVVAQGVESITCIDSDHGLNTHLCVPCFFHVNPCEAPFHSFLFAVRLRIQARAWAFLAGDGSQHPCRGAGAQCSGCLHERATSVRGDHWWNHELHLLLLVQLVQSPWPWLRLVQEAGGNPFACFCGWPRAVSLGQAAGSSPWASVLECTSWDWSSLQRAWVGSSVCAAHSFVYWRTDLDDDSLVLSHPGVRSAWWSLTFQWSKASTEVNLPWRKVGWERGVAIWNVSARLRDAREKSWASMMGSLWPGQHHFRWWLWSLPASFLLQPLSTLLRSRCTKDWARGGMTPAQNCCPELKWVMHPQKCQMHLSKIFNMTMLGERTWKRLTW